MWTLHAYVESDVDINSYDFANLPAGVRGWWLRYWVKIRNATTGIIMRFNADAGANYNYNHMYHDSTGHLVIDAAGVTVFLINSGGDPGAIVWGDVWIHAPFDNEYKTVDCVGDATGTAALPRRGFEGGGWWANNVNPINRISVLSWAAGLNLDKYAIYLYKALLP